MSALNFPCELFFCKPQNFVLNSESPTTFLDNADGPGVYLFTVQVENLHRVFYVGESQNISVRLREHLANYLSGSYTLYSRSGLEAGRLEFSWTSRGQLREQTLARLDQHRALLKEFFAVVGITYAVFPSDQFMRQRVESAILDALRKDPTTGEFLENYRVSVRSDADPHKIQVRCEEPILGLPSKLLV